jgi:hypothetical protein
MSLKTKGNAPCAPQLVLQGGEKAGEFWLHSIRIFCMRTYCVNTRAALCIHCGPLQGWLPRPASMRVNSTKWVPGAPSSRKADNK